ncbi:DMT family transporter [Facilibium subflavum]|uniref:DMT family transporter n=1 Tax=Facilibium subflavum TaxID=2219058 RepID=UPI000E64C4A9|nr:DMT family transporter [Facilibium subflavum]
MNYLLLLSIGVIWGAQFVLIDVSLQAYTPEQLALLRTLYALLFLMVFCWIVRPQKYQRSIKAWLKVALVGILEVVFPFALVMWGQQYVSGSMAAILMGTIPFFTLILVMLTKVERATGTKFLGMLVGFIGLVILFAPDLIASGVTGGILPKLAILLGALSFAGALTVIKSMQGENAFLLSRDAFFIGTIILILVNLYQGNLTDLHFPLGESLASLVLGILCSGVVYVLYVSLIKRAGAGFCSLSNYLVPLFGSLLGVLIMGDHLTANMIFACVLILLSIAVEPLVGYVYNRRKKRLFHESTK